MAQARKTSQRGLGAMEGSLTKSYAGNTKLRQMATTGRGRMILLSH